MGLAWQAAQSLAGALEGSRGKQVPRMEKDGNERESRLKEGGASTLGRRRGGTKGIEKTTGSLDLGTHLSVDRTDAKSRLTVEQTPLDGGGLSFHGGF